jgi:Transmembrane domain of unknown function (DUF3566)
VSSPNEPGYPRAGDGAGGANGSAPGSSGPAHEGGSLADVPPWQRGPAGRSRGQSLRKPSEPHARTDSQRSETSTAHSQGVDSRLNRFMSGSAAPAQESDSPARAERPERTERVERPERSEAGRPEAARPEAYASELPDLSGPLPRPPQQRQAGTERTTSEPASRPTAATGRVQAATRHKGPVRASMQIRRVDPWSTLKVSLVLSVALFFVWMIAVAFLYLVLGGMGVWSKLNSNVGDLLTSASGSGGELVSSGTIFGGAALVGLVNIVLLTAMATAAAFIYNLTTDLVGGIEVTLADRD